MTTVNELDATYGYVKALPSANKEEKTFQELDYLNDEEEFDSIDDIVPFRIDSASIAQYFVINLDIPCACTGLDHITMQRFWLFIMTMKEAIDALDKYNRDMKDIQHLFE